MDNANDSAAVPLPLRWRATALPWLLPLGLGLFVAELHNHWGQAAATLHLVALLLIAVTWITLLAGRRSAIEYGGIAINLVILVQAAGGLVLERVFDDVSGAEVLAELLFWAPAVCAWWATCYYGRPLRAAAMAVALYASFFVGGQLGFDHLLHEFILQGALMGGLVLLFGKTMASGAYCEGAQAFDVAMHDSLTNVASRPYFEAEMAHTSAICERYGQPFSLIVANINNFEGFCGDFGEGDGDRLLRAFSWLIAERIRASDSVCRWEGEKFAILLPNTRLPEAVKCAENLRHAVGTAKLGDKRAVSACFGVSEHRAGEDPMLTFETADRALARAQRNGDNLVVVDGSEAATIS